MSPVVSSSICWSKREIQAVDWARQKVVFIPEWNLLGGLTYCAVSVIFIRGKNVGTTLTEVCQSFHGVEMAIVQHRSLFVYRCAHIQRLVRGLSWSFGGSKYYVNLRSFYVWLPWIVIPTVTIVLSPLEGSTMNFALGNNFFSTYIGFACCLSILVLTPVCFAHL